MQNTLKYKDSLDVDGKSFSFYSLKKALKDYPLIEKLPFSLKVLFENLLRNEDGNTVELKHIKAINDWVDNRKSHQEIAYYPARVLMQDFTGVPAVVDLAAMRDAMKNLGGNAKKINPQVPVDLVIDHSVSVDSFGTNQSFQNNVQEEFRRNNERYEFLKWGQNAFENFRVVPPGTGICHQVNLENLGQVVWTKKQDGETLAYCDTLVGTDSHTTMINGLAILGWGVGGIEAEAAMLGQAVTMLIPEVVGFKLTGKLSEGTTATDLVLRVVQMLREKGVVGKFVEFYGPGLNNLSLADRATIANMAPEYGATCGFFPVDSETLNYLRSSGRNEKQIKLVEAYAKEQGLWRDENSNESPVFTDILELDVGKVKPSIAGPKRPQDRIELDNASENFSKVMKEIFKVSDSERSVDVEGEEYNVAHGDVVIAAITSCTNTSNPSVMLAAGLVAKKAYELGLKVKPWVKTSLAPGSQVVSDYLEKSGLQEYLDKLGFNLVGYGCTTCIGNSGPIDEKIAASVTSGDLVVTSVLSGNRNFEGRINPHVKANYLASPPLVVTYAIAGSMKIDITKDPIDKDSEGKPVYLKDIWPTNEEIAEALKANINSDMFKKRYANVFEGTDDWKKIDVELSESYSWNHQSTYVQNPPYFVGMKDTAGVPGDIGGAKALAILGDSVTTDHISPAGAIKADSPAGLFLQAKGISFADFNSYGSRRGNHEIMMRGTFANIRIKNEMLDGVEGGFTKYIPTGETLPIYDAAMKYASSKTPLIVVAGKEYGTGSSRDWAAKGTLLLGVKAVVAESFERIHRSNLIGMGVLPLQFKNDTRKTLNLDGTETFNILDLKNKLAPSCEIDMEIVRVGGERSKVALLCRIDTQNELDYYLNGGILQYVLRKLK
ncbi:MAG: aconitate hydratase AcnA [Halobacteriovoraceae bacterium]|nr:aconitate hydratase AcnA [Halobacteriovoraceae bacterium]